MAVRCESTHHVAEMSTVALDTHTDVGSDAIFSALLIYDQIKKVSLETKLFGNRILHCAIVGYLHGHGSVFVAVAVHVRVARCARVCLVGARGARR